MTIEGEVRHVDYSKKLVEVEVEGENNLWGMHMSGIVWVELPQVRNE